MDGPEIIGAEPSISGPTSADYSHLNTDWILARDEALTDVVAQSLADTVNLNKWQAPDGLVVDSIYWIGRLVRFSDGANIVDGDMQKISFRTATSFITNCWGDGTDGDVTISKNTALPSTLNGDMVVKNYKSLNIAEGQTLTVANQCRGLLLYVDGDCTIDGIIDMSLKGAKCNPADSTVTTATPVAPSDGNGVAASGLIIARNVAGGTYTGSSDLRGCGLAAVKAESTQLPISNGFALIFDRYNSSGAGGGGGGGGGAPFSGVKGLAGAAPAANSGGDGGKSCDGVLGGSGAVENEGGRGGSYGTSSGGGEGALGSCFSGGSGGGGGGSYGTGSAGGGGGKGCGDGGGYGGSNKNSSGESWGGFRNYSGPEWKIFCLHDSRGKCRGWWRWRIVNSCSEGKPYHWSYRQAFSQGSRRYLRG